MADGGFAPVCDVLAVGFVGGVEFLCGENGGRWEVFLYGGDGVRGIRGFPGNADFCGGHVCCEADGAGEDFLGAGKVFEPFISIGRGVGAVGTHGGNGEEGREFGVPERGEVEVKVFGHGSWLVICELMRQTGGWIDGLKSYQLFNNF